jgi:predicted amidophosphoribosyltransferase
MPPTRTTRTARTSRTAGSVLTGLLADLLDLALPMTCAACAAPVVRVGPAGVAGPTGPAGWLSCPVCLACRSVVEGAVAGPVRPSPPPAGMPPCAAWGAYAGTLRDLLLAYKERESWGLAGLLGAGLAAAVRVVSPGPGPLVLVPVPATAAAIRTRQGDHVRRLARVAATHLRRNTLPDRDTPVDRDLHPGREGRPVAVRSLVRALPTGVDSTELGAAARAERALSAFAPRAGALARIGAGPGSCAGGVEVVVVDDIVTTGATLGAVAAVLAGCGVGVGGVAVVAATPRRRSVTDGFGFSSGQTADFRRRPFYALGNHSDPRGHPRSASPGTS